MKKSAVLPLLIILAFILAGLELMLGSADIPAGVIPGILFSGENENDAWNLIILESRLPRLLAAISAGILLSVSGLQMQTLFRNPLAGPHILGVSAGASLGVAIVIIGLEVFSIQSAISTDAVTIFASFAGAMAILILLFLVSLRVGDVLTVLVFGVLLSAICLAAVGILQYFSPESQLRAFLIWTLGSFDGVEMREARVMIIAALPLLLLALTQLKPLNLLLAGEEQAASLGLHVKRSRLIIMTSAGAMTAIVTAYCGPIGFVGVVVPHFARLLCRTFDHRILFFVVILTGMNVMMLADLLAHMPGSDYILPLSSVTSLIGIPFLFWILMKKKTITAV